MINKNPNQLQEIVTLFKELEIDKQIVLIGSWCELFYENILNGFEANIRTTDVDIYYHDFKKPQKSINFISAMESIGFYIEESVYPVKSRFYSEELEVEFLTRLSRNNEPTAKIEPLNIYAECLTECEMFGNTKNIMLCKSEKYDIEIQVPTPVAYTIHKILIHDKRKENKQRKDKESIYRLIPYIENDESYMKDWNRIVRNFSKKEKRRFSHNLELLNLNRLNS